MNDVSGSNVAAPIRPASQGEVQPAPPPVVTSFPDWPNVFLALPMRVPVAEDPEFTTASPSIVRGLFIDLTSLAPQLARRLQPDGPLEIHADVLRLSAPTLLVLSSLVIHARRVEVVAGAALSVRPAGEAEPRCTLDVAIGELALQAPATAWRIDLLGVEQLLCPAEAPCRLRCACAADGAAQHVVSGRIGADIAPGDALQAELQLLTAKRLQHAPAGTEPEPAGLALRLCQWVNRCQAQAGGDLKLAAESAVLTDRLLGSQRQLHFVPYLQLGQYDELAKETAAALEAVETQSERFFDRDADIRQRQAAAQDMLRHYQNARRVSQKLLAQAKRDMDEAESSSRDSATKLQALKDELDKAQKRFEEGRNKKEEELKQKATWAIIGAVVALGIGVAVACTGNPAGVASAAGAAKAAEGVAEQVGKLRQLIQRIAKAIAAINKLLQAVSALNAAYGLVKTHLDSTQRVEQLKTLRSAATPGESLTSADWDVFCVEMRSMFKSPIELGIDGAEEYLGTLEKMAIRGKDAIDTGLHFAHCAQVFHQRLWENERDEGDFALVESRSRQLDAQRGPDFRMMMFFYRLRSQLKLQLIQAIDNIGHAFRYYALREPGYAPSIADSPAELKALLATAMAELVGARETFASPPASWGPQVYRIWARASLDRLRAEQRLAWTISLANFRGFDRIRIAEIRVWLISPTLGRAKIQIKIGTSGTYRDRLDGQTFEFATEPLRRTFEYQAVADGPARNHRGEPVLITAKADDVEQAYFEPTPFTTWEIWIPRALNPGLSLDDVSEVGLEFHGSYIGSRRVGAARAPFGHDMPAAAPLELTVL